MKIIIVGGVAGGASCAARLRRWRPGTPPLPTHTITVDLISGRAVVRESGDAVHAITESINIPIISKPIFRDGQALVDGGLIDNVPADVLTRKD